MKAFFLWLGGAALAFAALAGGLHAYHSANPTRVLVVVDVSLPMTPELPRLGRLLDSIDDQRYAIFALHTDRSQVHGWRDGLQAGQLRGYGPRDFTRLPALRHEADRLILVTNAAEAELAAAASGWEIRRP